MPLDIVRKSVDQMIDELIGREGRYSFHPNDSGGETMWGITAVTARRNGYVGAMSQMPRETAEAIYRAEYFIKPGYDRVANLSPAIAEEMFDTGVNGGMPTLWLQRMLNVLNRQGRDYADIRTDAVVGPATLAALEHFLKKRGANGERVLLRGLNCLQGARLIDITEARPKNEDFIYGWLLNRVGLA